ncbi:peptidase C60 sortase A and B [Stackebrandtia nassauensis DSM 44728]|uniref:Peptidase C60 sortase A and B n=1 Tax=Stackebrandtia nassauensis (strain DSM 44728 / CIP 108903 / NRRL B-16338 / NBRC 102104 / LLR-40K-21) TaxID=446470 RepID=D3QBF3_STANL|nr:peptidase C60 sortase A and B [Stackebrandtia nassauensis DSM 44728]
MAVCLTLTVIAAAGCGLMLGALTPLPSTSPQPQAVPVPPSVPPVPSLSPGQIAPPGLSRSTPTVVDIAAIGVHSPVTPVGLDRDGTIEAPDLDQPHQTGWYSHGPAPGQIGTAALVGHVDSRRSGAAVFYDLGSLETGDSIVVSRRDGRDVTFTVDLVESYPKKKFPYGAVFTNTGYAALRLITCGGNFDTKRRSYTHNIVVYATMAT